MSDFGKGFLFGSWLNSVSDNSVGNGCGCVPIGCLILMFIGLIVGAFIFAVLRITLQEFNVI